MDNEKRMLINRATAKGNIYPLGQYTTLNECFTVETIKGESWLFFLVQHI